MSHALFFLIQYEKNRPNKAKMLFFLNKIAVNQHEKKDGKWKNKRETEAFQNLFEKERILSGVRVESVS